MNFDKLAIALMTDNVKASRDFYVGHFGFEPAVELDWYVSLHHPDHADYVIDLVARDHASMPAQFRGRSVDGLTIALVVLDAALEERRLRENDVAIADPLADMPWGQRRFHVLAPEGTVIEVVQFIEPDAQWVADQLA